MQESSSPGTTQGVSHIIVDDDTAGQRIDNLLIKRFPDLPRSRVYRIIRKGEVRVNGGRIKPKQKLAAGDRVRVPPLHIDPAAAVSVPDALVAELEASVFYEDDAIVVLNKPPGIAVHAGSGLPFGVIDAIRQSRDSQRFELIHRLDRHTSGCLLIGKTLKATRSMQDLFRARTIGKRYLAIVAGSLTADELVVENHLEANVEVSGERMVVAGKDGKLAVSRFQTLEDFGRATEVEVSIDTGRTHQIRVHAAGLGHPVVGDKKYGDPEANRQFRVLGLKRMYLHAARVVIPDGPELNCQPGVEWQQAKDICRDSR